MMKIAFHITCFAKYKHLNDEVEGGNCYDQLSDSQYKLILMYNSMFHSKNCRN